MSAPNATAPRNDYHAIVRDLVIVAAAHITAQGQSATAGLPPAVATTEVRDDATVTIST